MSDSSDAVQVPNAAKSEQRAAPWLGIVTIVLTLAAWTSIPPMLKHFAGLIDGWTANGWRYGFSALVWLPVLVWHARRKSTPAGLWKAALPASVFNIGAQVCFGLAPYFISPGLMTFCLRLQVVFVMFGAAVLFVQERRVIRSGLFIVGMSLLLVGTLLTIAFNEQGLGEAKSAMGVGLAVGSGILYAGYALCVRRFMMGIPPLTAFAAVSQYTGAALVGLMLVLGDRSGLLGTQVTALRAAGEAVPSGWVLGGASVFALARADVMLLLLSAVVGIGIGHTLYYYSLQRLGLAVSSGVVQLQPVTVSMVSLVVFGDALKPLQWVTGVGAICGAILMLWAQQRMARRGE